MTKTVYRLDADPDRYRWLTVVDPPDWDRLELLRSGKPVSSGWTPIAVVDLVEYDEDERKPRCDFPVFGSVPTFSERAATALHDVLAGNGELLPLVGAAFFVYNVTRVVDALDEQRSTLTRFASSGRIMKVERYVLKDDQLQDAPVFKLPQYCRVAVFVNDVFRSFALQAKLTGCRFAPIWPDGAA